MDYDIVIVGAGIAGINAAYRLQTQLPNHRYAILEARNAIGGTWDLFRYPGIRSDSDLFTFGFSWNPWPQDNLIAEGASISKYMRDTAAQVGIDKHIQFQHRLLAADWSSSENVWKLAVDHEGELKSYTARFVIFGTGYYNYDEPLSVEIPGLERFQGKVIHPQFWPEDLDYSGKKVVIIGSGATAITLLPKMAETAAKATMLQRSPTYILPLPNRQNPLLSYIFPTALSRKLQRLQWIIVSRIFFLFCQAFPWLARSILKLTVIRRLPKHVPFEPHFKPRYNPWDQRLCVSPDGDFFQSLHTGRADVKTDTIRQVTASGIELNSGETLDADIIVTATGLKLQIAGGTSITVDGQKQRVSDKYLWNGVMLQDLPNASFVIGYTNASWTLGADATALFVCRLLKYMKQQHKAAAVPRVSPALASRMQQRQLLNLNSTYVTAAQKDLPKAADRGPWKPRDNYLSDLFLVQYGRIDEGLEWVDELSRKQQ
ncbi:flavin-containing monooxygenase [Aspergillus clavatus NRRL 1]|uniref:Flavin-binding monooxygenase, putative n=1 Tax=Aspergillus clavatus (strain ATCC 1007 / CBS 513.65 / DSM 816 / NCTC 3887 / NRRL 1 / QM 1276 / 107) TaxID=344612 RepID=A1C8G0_ASPCL|nr:flavin-binding monooxygenase, putative [Aspergillus clavatus NRRL 1]EAW13597.1 flavin-binding monooxygenase, putative [Aspergillus clavatus NRRL 1]